MLTPVNTGSQFYRIRPDVNSWSSVTPLHTPIKNEESINHQPPPPHDEIVDMTTVLSQNDLKDFLDLIPTADKEEPWGRTTLLEDSANF